MSDEKYIINKDSLTGIADAVRNKLGESTSYSIDDIQDKITNYWSIPEGSLNISANGTYDVTTKASAIVNVPNPSTGSLEITENGTYDVTDKASAVVNVPSGGGLPPLTTVPTFNVYSGRAGGTSRINLSSRFSTQEEMLDHLVDIELGSPGNNYNNVTGSYGSNSSRYPICKDKYGRWISMKKLGITLPSSLTCGYNSPATQSTISAAHNNDLTFCFGTVSPFSQGLPWIAIVDRYILLGNSNYIDYITDWYTVIVEA